MLLKSMTLKNFRQFVDSTIEFSTDKEKNVTLVLARNKTGKTTLTNAFTWCLYGITNFKVKSVLNRKIRHNMQPNDSVYVSVEIKIQYGQYIYSIKRSQRFKNNQTILDKNRIEPDAPYLYISETNIDTGFTKGIDDDQKQEILDSLIPKDLSEYFFMRSEQITSMSDAFQTEDSDEKFATAVKKILGMQPIEKAIKHLYDQQNNSVYALFQKDYKGNANNKIDEINKAIIDLQTKISKNEEAIKKADENIPKLAKRIANLEIEIAKWEEPKKQQKEMKDLQEKVDLNELSINNYKINFLKRFAKNLPYLCLKNIVPEITSNLKDTKIEDEYVPDVTEKTIINLIKRGYCLCGTKCAIGSDAHKELLSQLDKIPPKSVGNLVANFVKEARIYTSSDMTTDMLQDYTDTTKSLLEKQADLDELNERINNLRGNLKENKDTSKLENEKEEKDKELKSLSNDKANKYATNIQLNKDLTKKRGELQNLSSADKENAKVLKCQEHTKYLYTVLKNTLTNKETSLRQSLIAKMNEIFSSVFGESYKIKLNEKYKLSITDSYDNPEKIDASGAQGVYILLSFITSVLYLARQNESEIDTSDDILISEPYPLVLDAPLSTFDDDIIPDICEKLPELTEQIVIFSKYIDGKLIKKHMQDKIGKFYTMSPATLDNNKEDVLETKVEEGVI